MFKRVDEATGDDLEGFSYKNKDGDEEYVTVADGNTVTLYTTYGESVVYVDDIPLTIKALQAAYDHAKAE